MLIKDPVDSSADTPKFLARGAEVNEGGNDLMNTSYLKNFMKKEFSRDQKDSPMRTEEKDHGRLSINSS